ncbi:LOW QUALITY PROTEIN: hypothetical protein PHPALM_7085 [Phytophthora palmivora]|uniref:HTH CENPB-type domain-containing protein n=1 Tax=Phytophthora palmivora TaxID=4796 RepID=A0A2P4YD75_9STRA|nr:LOW QUALITY PROTEIN: hypothetical protein PHPALM_7085 [Phytophthora palmivora]
MAPVRRHRPGRKHGPNGTGQRKQTFSRTRETYETKLAIINHYALYKDMKRTLAKFYLGIEEKARETKRRSVHFFWEKAEIEAHSAPSCRAAGTGTTLSMGVEDELVLWIQALRNEGVPVPAFTLQEKALEVAEASGIDLALFKATWTFWHMFLLRHALSQSNPPGATVAARCASSGCLISYTMLMSDHGVDRVYNAVQTAVLFEYIPKQTVSMRGQKIVQGKARVTLILLGDSAGVKYTPIFVTKSIPSGKPDTAGENIALRHGFGKHVWKEISELPAANDVVVYTNTKGWRNYTLSLTFLSYHFSGRADTDKPDDLSAHWTDEVQRAAKELNVILVKIPTGCIGVCQPANISWNRSLKAYMRSKWVVDLQEQL